MRKAYPFMSRNWVTFIQKTVVKMLRREDEIGSGMLRHAKTIRDIRTKEPILIDRELEKKSQFFL